MVAAKAISTGDRTIMATAAKIKSKVLFTMHFSCLTFHEHSRASPQIELPSDHGKIPSLPIAARSRRIPNCKKLRSRKRTSKHLDCFIHL